jgi:hypothetical protein
VISKKEVAKEETKESDQWPVTTRIATMDKKKKSDH